MKEKTNPIKAHRYVDLLTDSGFKAVFGDQKNKQVLIDFLNAVLPDGRQVQDLTYSTTEIPGFAPNGKSVRLDLRCTDVDGTHFIVEMQKYNQKNFFKRCILYSSRVYGMDLSKGDADYDIPPVYLVAILAGECLNREHPFWDERFISEYTFREKVTGDTPDDTIFCTFVELKRFDKKLSECRNIIDKWCYALKYMSRLDKLPKEFQKEVFRRLFEASEIAQFSEDKRIKYEQEMISERDYNNILATAREEGLKMGHEEGYDKGLFEGREIGREEGLEEGREEGREIGREEGRKEGREEERLDVARKMKDRGISISEISIITGIDKKLIEEL